MSKKAEKHNDSGMKLFGMTFMGFLMGLGAILGIWFLAGLLQVLSKLKG